MNRPKPAPSNSNSGRYSSLNLAHAYKPGSSRPIGRPGMVFAAGRGKSAVKAPAAPKPVNLPSLKREHSGYDPNIALVPSGGAGWKAGGHAEAAVPGAPPASVNATYDPSSSSPSQPAGVHTATAPIAVGSPVVDTVAATSVSTSPTQPVVMQPMRPTGAAPAWGGAGMSKPAPADTNQPAPPPPPVVKQQPPTVGRRLGSYTGRDGMGLGRDGMGSRPPIGAGGIGGGLGDRHVDTLGAHMGGRFDSARPGFDRQPVLRRNLNPNNVVHWPGLADVEPAAPTPAPPAPAARPTARLDEALTGAKIDMVQVRDDGTGWGDESSDDEMTYDEDVPLFDDMPVKSAHIINGVKKTGPQANGYAKAVPETDARPVAETESKKQSAPSSPVVVSQNSSAPGSPAMVSVDGGEEPEELEKKQLDVMKSTALQARERREAEEREQERLRKERAEAKLKALEDARFAAAAPVRPKPEPAAPKPAELKHPVEPPRPPADTTVRPNVAPSSDISSKQEEVMKSTAQQARERRLAEEQEQERLRKERADAKLKELESKRQQKELELKRQQKAKEDEAEKLKQAAANASVVKIMERPREQSRFNLWVDPDASSKQSPKKEDPKKKEQPKGFEHPSKFKSDDRDWRARDASPPKNFTLAKRPAEGEKDRSETKKNDKINDKEQDGSKHNRRDKEQKKREQAASLIDIPKPLPPGTTASQEQKPADPKNDADKLSASDGMPNIDWPVKKMRKFCEEHLVPVTRNDSPQSILSKIEQSINGNGGMLRQKGQKKKVTETPKPRPSSEAKGEARGDSKEEDRKERRREREAKGRERRKKGNDVKAEKEGESGKDKKEDMKREDRERKEDKKEVKAEKKREDDKSKPAEDKVKAGVPTLESQGLQPIADGLMVGMGVAVAAGEVVSDHSGFTTVETHDKNQRKEEQKKREAAREKELRDERRREKEEQRRRDKSVKLPTPAPAPVAKPEAALDMAKSVPGDDLALLGGDLDLGLHDAPRPHPIQDLNQQAVPKVAWGSDISHLAPKKPVSLLQVQVEEKFNKRLDPQFDVELEPQQQSSSSAIGSERRDGPSTAADPWAASVPTSNESFGAAFNAGMGAQGTTVGVLPNDSFNALQGLNMLQIRPSSHPPVPTSFSTSGTASTATPRFQALGLAMLGGADPFASAFGAPAGMDGWPFAAPGSAPSPMSFAQEGAAPADSNQRWAQPRNNAVGHQRAVGGGGKRSGGAVQVAPGPSAPQAVAEGVENVQKRHGRGKGNGPGTVGAPIAGDNNNSNGGKGQKQKSGAGTGAGVGGKRNERRGRGPKESSVGDNTITPTATPRAAKVDNDNSGSGGSKGGGGGGGKGGGGGGGKGGSGGGGGKGGSGVGANNRQRPRRAGGGKSDGKKSDNSSAPAIAIPAPSAPQRAD